MTHCKLFKVFSLTREIKEKDDQIIMKLKGQTPANELNELREENRKLKSQMDEICLRLEKAMSNLNHLMALKLLPPGNHISNAGQNGYEFNGYNQQQQQLQPPPPYQNPSQGHPPHQNEYQQQHYPQYQPQLHYQHQNHDIQRSYGYINGAAGMGVPSMQYGGVHHSQHYGYPGGDYPVQKWNNMASSNNMKAVEIRRFPSDYKTSSDDNSSVIDSDDDVHQREKWSDKWSRKIKKFKNQRK
jgi:hypothetical protein